MRKSGRGGKFGPNGGRRLRGDEEAPHPIINEGQRDPSDVDERIEGDVEEGTDRDDYDGYVSLDGELSDPPDEDDILPPLHLFQARSNIGRSSSSSEDASNIASTSTSTMTRPSVEYPTTFKRNGETCLFLYEQDGRIEPADKMSRKIYKMFVNGTNKNGYNWKHVPKEKRIVYWREFKKKCAWHSKNNALVKTTYRAKVKERYKNFTYRVRRSIQKPDFLDKQSWDNWRRIWATPKFQKLAKQNQDNRNATPSLHTGGSISFSEHKRRLKKKLEREPRIDEFFEHVRMKKKVAEKEFVDERARKCHEQYHKIIQERIQNDSGSGSGSSSIEPTQEEQLSAFLEAA